MPAQFGHFASDSWDFRASKKESGRWGDRPLGRWGMEGTVLRSQLNLRHPPLGEGPVPLRSRAAARQSEAELTPNHSRHFARTAVAGR
jgi:hypothetical protein